MSRMHDIAGCRTVVGNLEDMRAIRDIIFSKWEAREIDYVSKPRQSGYRAIHAIVSHQGKPVEIQIRTKVMHDWAEMVEAFSREFDENFKQDGETVVQQYMLALSEIMSATEVGGTPSTDSLVIVEKLRPSILELLEAARKGEAGENKNDQQH